MEIQSVTSEEKPPVKSRTARQREASRNNEPGPQNAGRQGARNARRHGLTVSAIADPAFRQQVTNFAHAIAGPNADAAELALATRVAAAHIDMWQANRAAWTLIRGRTRTPFGATIRLPAWKR
jgi:hypothetical protein